jgi:L-ascorbate metabolism protein UlaG (beta-lactamase superfamily)
VPVEVTWWGHATCTVEDSGIRVLTDPLFARRLAHLRRRRGALPPSSAWRADIALVSHLHADHLHVPSLARLAPGTRLLVPRGAPRTVPGLRRLSHLSLTEVLPGDETAAGDLRIRVVPAEHDGRRLPLGPRRSPGMAEEVGPVDAALLPVGGWGPYLGEGHLDPGRAAEALARLSPGSAVPVHYGTYWPIGMDAVRPHEFHTPGDEFARLAALRAPGVAVHRLGHGESVRLEAAR